MTPESIIARATALGISTNELQRQANLGSSFMWRWKTGRIKPRPATLERITDILEGIENGC